MRKLSRFAVLVAILVFAACSFDISPVDIEDSDMCSFCRMAISEKRYAGELIETDGGAKKFDDIGCMLRYIYAQGDAYKPLAVYVADSITKKWLKADEAFFVRSTSVKTPMGSGILAFRSAQDAGDGAVRWNDLTK